MDAKALFLDRDGIINFDSGYVYRIDDVIFMDGVIDLITHANRRGYMVIIVTNQVGIGRGFYTEEQFHSLMDWMCKELEQRGALINKYYFSTCYPTEGVGKFLRDDPMRKPNPGMFLAAQADFAIDMAKSVMLGDKLSDMQASIAAGVSTNLLFVNDSDAIAHDGEFLRIRRLVDACNYLTD